MALRQYKPPRVNNGDMRTFVTFFEYEPSEGPEPGESKKNELFSAWAKVDEVWLKDIELAKSTGTLSDITLTIRDPQGDFWPTNKHYLSIDAKEYADIVFNIKHAQPDMQQRDFINVIAGVSS